MSGFAAALIVLLAVSLAGFAAGGGLQRARLVWIAVPIGASLAGAALYALQAEPAQQAATAESPLAALAAPSAEPLTPLAPAHPGVDDPGARNAGDMNDMAAKLAARLEKNPNDGPGWALLGRAYAWMKRYTEADAAFARAAKLKVDDPNLQADWDAARAKEASSAQATPRPATASAVAGSSISGTVSIAYPLQHTLHRKDTVFVFARAPRGGAPLAVKRFKAKDLPAAFRLDDGDAMEPGHNLSSTAEVQLVARLSASGSAIRQPGDIETKPLTVKPGISGVELEIGAPQ